MEVEGEEQKQEQEPERREAGGVWFLGNVGKQGTKVYPRMIPTTKKFQALETEEEGTEVDTPPGLNGTRDVTSDQDWPKVRGTKPSANKQQPARAEPKMQRNKSAKNNSGA